MNECIEKLESTGDYRIIKRFVPVEHYCTPTPEDIKIGIYIDTETTGINPNKEEIIELAMVPFEFDSAGKIYRILPEYNSFQDPHKPIPEKITQITGITDDMVKGQSIDMAEVVNRHPAGRAKSQKIEKKIQIRFFLAFFFIFLM